MAIGVGLRQCIGHRGIKELLMRQYRVSDIPPSIWRLRTVILPNGDFPGACHDKALFGHLYWQYEAVFPPSFHFIVLQQSYCYTAHFCICSEHKLPNSGGGLSWHSIRGSSWVVVASSAGTWIEFLSHKIGIRKGRQSSCVGHLGVCIATTSWKALVRSSAQLSMASSTDTVEFPGSLYSRKILHTY